jgi:hypothetical protein
MKNKRRLITVGHIGNPFLRKGGLGKVLEPVILFPPEIESCLYSGKCAKRCLSNKRCAIKDFYNKYGTNYLNQE